MRILFVSEYFSPRNAGGEVWSLQLCTELAARGHEITVITGRFGTLPEKEYVGNIRVLRPVSIPVSIHSRVLRALQASRLAQYVGKYLKENSVDVVHVMAYALSPQVSAIAAKRGVRCITSVHSYFGENWKKISKLPRILQWFEQRALRTDKSAVIHVPSQYLQRRIKDETGRNATVIHNWIDETFPLPKKIDGLLFVGSLEEVKNPLACISAAKSLQMPLYVIGSGSLERRLRDAAEREGVSLTLYRSASHEETLAYLGGAPLLLVPSVTESFSLVALEAVAQGTPVSGNPVGILPELTGVVPFPPTHIPQRVSSKEQQEMRSRFDRQKIVREFELLYIG